MWIELGQNDFLINLNKIVSINMNKHEIEKDFRIYYQRSENIYWTEYFYSIEECEKRFNQVKEMLLNPSSRVEVKTIRQGNDGNNVMPFTAEFKNTDFEERN